MKDIIPIIIIYLIIAFLIYRFYNNRNSATIKIVQEQQVKQTSEQKVRQEQQLLIDNTIDKTVNSVKEYIEVAINKSIKSSKINNDSIESRTAQKLVKELTLHSTEIIEKAVKQFGKKSSLIVQQKLETLLKQSTPKVRQSIQQLVEKINKATQNIMKEVLENKELMQYLPDAKQLGLQLGVEAYQLAQQVGQQLVEDTILRTQNIIHEAIVEKKT